MRPSALEAYVGAARDLVGNPSSLHWAGREARRALEDARESIAACIHADPGSIVFTSGGTESDNIAIQGVLHASAPGKIITSAIEHPAVLQPLSRWASREAREQGWQLVQVRPGSDGRVSAEDFISRIDDSTRLVCIMWANNETGVIQPVKEIVRHCRVTGVPVLVDAVQALGKLSLDCLTLDADFVALSAHKIGGPRGVGALVVRRGVKVRELAPGGGQERKRRSGTENVPGVVAFAAALREADFSSYASMRDAFERALEETIPDAVVFGREAERVANTSLFSIPGLDGETLLMQLDLAGFAVASGSACSSGKREPSHVLLAMGVKSGLARSAVRISFGPGNVRDDGLALVRELGRIRQRLRTMAGVVS